MEQRTFEGIRENEQVVCWIEKHWIKYVRVFFIFSVVGILPGLIVLVSALSFFQNTFSLNAICFGVFLYELFALLYIYIYLLSDELDLFIVTTERIVDITQVNLFNRRIADTPLENIQDVVAETNGFFQTLLNFGVITVQTAGKTAQFSMNLIPDPFEKSKIILSLLKGQESIKTSASVDPQIPQHE